MWRRPQAADIAALVVLAALAGLLGTGLGMAAAHVRSSSSQERGPLRIILRPSAHRPASEAPSLQRDRVRLRP